MQKDYLQTDDLFHARAQESPFATIIDIAMPPDPKPIFIWRQLVVAIQQRYFRNYSLHLISLLLLIFTVMLITLLRQLPPLRQSVLSVLAGLIEHIIPSPWATIIAVLIGILIILRIGGLTHLTPSQRRLDDMPIQKPAVYRFFLWAALREEQMFRSGSEHWSWLQKIQASMVFGVAHIVNFWYSFAAGIALSVTGFGFLLVYTYYYRKTHDQIIATSASTIVHAVYNTIIITAVVAILAFWAIKRLVTGL